MEQVSQLVQNTNFQPEVSSFSYSAEKSKKNKSFKKMLILLFVFIIINSAIFALFYFQNQKQTINTKQNQPSQVNKVTKIQKLPDTLLQNAFKIEGEDKYTINAKIIRFKNNKLKVTYTNQIYDFLITDKTMCQRNMDDQQNTASRSAGKIFSCLDITKFAPGEDVVIDFIYDESQSTAENITLY